MVVATGAAIVTVATGGAAAVAGAGLGAGAGVSGGMAGAVGTISAGAGAAASTTAGVAGGAILGTGAAVTGGASGTAALAGTAVGAVAGGTSGAGVSGLVTFVAGTGGWGLLALGTSLNSDKNGVTYDCWKPVLHDTSEEPSNGMLMKDVVSHPHVAKVTVNEGLVPELPQIVLENIWNESFKIDYVLFVETGEVACHARPFNGESD